MVGEGCGCILFNSEFLCIDGFLGEISFGTLAIVLIGLSRIYPGRKIEYQDLTRIVHLIISNLIRSDENCT
jgi:hypothetical protein